MTKEQQRIAIAEACGWEQCTHCDCGLWQPAGFIHGKDRYGLLKETNNLPNYPNDLNAMHEAESIICTSIDWTTKYMTILKRIGSMRGIRSTAAQRAEAFLRTKGLWRDE